MPGKKENLAYIAGILDGEGAIMIAHHKKKDGGIQWQLRINISNTNKDILDWINSLFASTVYLESKKEKCKPIYRWAIYDKKAEDFLKSVYPYLRMKRLQADTAFNFRKTYAKRKHPTPISILNKRKEFKDEIQLLNKKGI